MLAIALSRFQVYYVLEYFNWPQAVLALLESLDLFGGKPRDVYDLLCRHTYAQQGLGNFSLSLGHTFSQTFGCPVSDSLGLAVGVPRLEALALREFPLRQNVPFVHLVNLIFKFLLLVARRHLARLCEPLGNPSGLLDPFRDPLEASAVPEYIVLKNRNIFSDGLFFYRICQDTKRFQPDLN